VREKYYWLASGGWLVLVWCERKILLARCSEQGECVSALAKWKSSMSNFPSE